MKALPITALAVSLVLGSALSAQRPERQSGPDASKVIDTYCSGCHNGRVRAPGGRVLDQFDAAGMSAAPELWSRAYRQLQAGTMPPFGASRPDRAAVDAVLISIEQASGTHAKPPAVASSQEIASRLATLLWNSAPDAALLQDAQRNALSDPAVLERHVHRMLADDRARAFVSRFFFPWLQVDQLEKADPDTKYFPDYDPSLRESLATETELFLLSQLRDDRDPLELWSADYTFMNEQLARHYGVPNVTGPQFRAVTWPTPERAGLLGQGSILMVTSRHQHGVDAGYTSPAARSKWVRLHFLGAPLPQPFPGAQPVKPELPITPQTRALPAQPCVTCHRNFFPLGYALENFDPLGRWRTNDQVGPVDASGAFVDGTSTNGVIELRQVLLQRPEAFRTTITEQLLMYVLAGKVTPFGETPETLMRARQILRGTAEPRWSAIIAAIVRAKPPAEG
jgi:mono/diheme cytochrome c family protein